MTAHANRVHGTRAANFCAVVAKLGAPMARRTGFSCLLHESCTVPIHSHLRPSSQFFTPEAHSQHAFPGRGTPRAKQDPRGRALRRPGTAISALCCRRHRPVDMPYAEAVARAVGTASLRQPATHPRALFIEKSHRFSPLRTFDITRDLPVHLPCIGRHFVLPVHLIENGVNLPLRCR